MVSLYFPNWWKHSIVKHWETCKWDVVGGSAEKHWGEISESFQYSTMHSSFCYDFKCLASREGNFSRFSSSYTKELQK